jgi:hypothetical protein
MDVSAVDIIVRPDGKVDVGSTVRLPGGQVRGQAVTMEAGNLPLFADRMEAFLAGRVSQEVDHVLGDDVIAFVYGGTDYQPVISIINLGPNRGTLWIGPEQAAALPARIRDFVAHGR